MFRKRIPGVSSGNRKSSAADGSQSDWRHDQTVSSGRKQSSSTRDINSRGERPQIPWCVAVEDSHSDFEEFAPAHAASVNWLGGRKGIRPVKTEWWGAGVVI